MKKLYILSLFLILFSVGIVSKIEAACNITVTLSQTTVTVNVGGNSGTLTATAHNNAGAVTYAWAPCSTLNTSTGASVIATPVGSTTYTVTAFDANGCTATATCAVNVVDPSIAGSGGGASTVSGGYTYSYSMGGGVFNSMAGATVLATNSGMTNTNYNIDLSGLSPAFNFVFPGGTFNQFGVNTNGYVFLGAAAVATDNQPIASTDPCTGIISGWGTALQGAGGTGGGGSNIEYVVSGSSPNRTLTIQWTSAQFQSRGTHASQVFNMQIILYEADYHVDFIYSDQFSQPISNQVGNVQIGLRGATNADFLDRTGAGGGGFGWDPSQTSAGVNNTDAVAFIGGFFASYIAGPDRITYAPSSCIGTRTNITPSGTTDLCPSGSVDLSATAGSSYQWYMNGTLTGITTQTLSGITAAGTYVALTTPSVGCASPSYVMSVTINAAVTSSVTMSSNPNPLCSTNAMFTAVPTNGGCVPTYQWLLNGSAVANISLNVPTYTNLALHPNDQIQVVMTTGALCVSQATDTSNTLTNLLPAVATIAGGASTVCANSATSAFTNATTGGTWSINAGTGTASISAGGVVTGLTAGTVTVVYSYSNGTCTNSVTAPLTVNALPNIASITGKASVCGDFTTQLSDVVTGGSWSSGTPSVATVDASGMVTGVSAGSSVITYSTSANGCTSSVTLPVTVNALPGVASISGILSVCNNSTIQLSDATTGGTWSSGTTSVATVDGSGMVTGVSGGTSSVTYSTATDANGCVNSATATVTVNPLPNIASITGIGSVCMNSTTQLSDATTGGTWSSGTTSVATVDGSGIVAGITAGSSVITYITTADINGCTNSTTATVTVNALPSVASITGTLSVCSNSTVQLSDTTTGGSWSSGTTSAATVDASGVVTGVAGGNSTITYTTASDVNGCTASSSASVTINQTPSASASGNSPLCSGGALNLSSSGGTGYSWTGPNGFTSLQQNPGIPSVVLADSGIYTVTVTDANGCTASMPTSVTVSLTPPASASGNSPVCSGSGLNLSSGGGGGYSWTGPNGFTSAQQNPGIPNVVLADSGIYTVTVTDAGGCSASTTTTISINQSPIASASSNSPLCSGGTLNLSSGGGTGYSWTGPNGFTSAQQNPGLSNTLLADSGIYTVTVTAGNGCTATMPTSVAINKIPTASASGNSPVCYGDSLKLFSSGGTGYSWTGPGNFTSAQQNPDIAIAFSVDSGTYKVSVAGANGCAATDSVSIIVFPALPHPIITQSGNTLFCNSNPAYSSYQWFDSTARITGAIDTFLVITHSGKYNVQTTDENGCVVATGTTATFTGILEYVSDNLVLLSPNPANSQINIHTSFLHANEAVTISVINILGEITQQEKINTSDQSSLKDGGFTINIGNLPSGIYFLQLNLKNGNVVKRFVKE